MSCEHLICAQCAGPVTEGRCPTCRAARARVHSHGHGGLSAQLVVAAVLLLALVALAASHLAR